MTDYSKWRKTMKNVLKWGLGIVAVLSIAWLIVGESFQETETQQTAKEKPGQSNDAPPFETTAGEIAKAYANDAVAADEKYKNKAFIVSGSVVDKSTDPSEHAVLILEGGIDPLLEPHFTLADSEKSKAAELKKGQKVKLQCYGKGEVSKIAHAEDCEILFIDWN
ncbi:OB-fold protein [Methylophilus sp.]|uniref:OB-fold protein n=1 Tax=Methylophilus sp. TaxID=29541 RepID=UPI0040353751